MGLSTTQMKIFIGNSHNCKVHNKGITLEKWRHVLFRLKGR